MHGLSDRLRKARESSGLTQDEVAAAFGINRVNLSTWESGKTVPGAERLPKLAELYEVSVDWLMRGVGSPPTLKPRAKQTKRSIVSSFDPDAPEDRTKGDGHEAMMAAGGVAEVDTRAGMGNGGLNDVEVRRDGDHADPIKDERWHFPPTFVRNDLRAPESRLLVVETEGDSMFPTIWPGERVIVDTGNRRPGADGIYAIRDRFGGLQIKRLQAALTGEPPMVQVVSDNKSHPISIVGLDEIEIVGKVLYGLKRY